MVQNFAYNDDVDKYPKVSRTFDENLVANASPSHRDLNMPFTRQYSKLKNDLHVEQQPIQAKPFARNYQRFRFDKIDPNVRISHFPLPDTDFDMTCSSPDVFHENAAHSRVSNPTSQRFKQSHSPSYHTEHMCACSCYSENTMHQALLLQDVGKAKKKTKACPQEGFHSMGLVCDIDDAINLSKNLHYNSRSTDIVNTENIAPSSVQSNCVIRESENCEIGKVQEVELQTESADKEPGIKCCCKMSKGAIAIVAVLLVLVIVLAAGFLVFRKFLSLIFYYNRLYKF